MSTITAESKHAERWSRLDPRHLQQPAALVFNPNAGHKLGVDTNSSGPDEVQAALKSEGIAFDAWPTERAGHATDLARQAVAEGRELVIAAGGDGTVNEVAHGLANTQTALGLMPLGSVMNVARTLWVPRDLADAAHTIAEGKVLAMDMGRVGDRFFLEAAGVGLDAGLFGYFERLEQGAHPLAVIRAGLRFLRQIGSPRLTIEHDAGRLETRAPMVSVANGPYVGAAYAIAPDARIDDGLLDLVVSATRASRVCCCTWSSSPAGDRCHHHQRRAFSECGPCVSPSGGGDRCQCMPTEIRLASLQPSLRLFPLRCG